MRILFIPNMRWDPCLLCTYRENWMWRLDHVNIGFGNSKHKCFEYKYFCSSFFSYWKWKRLYRNFFLSISLIKLRCIRKRKLKCILWIEILYWNNFNDIEVKLVKPISYGRQKNIYRINSLYLKEIETFSLLYFAGNETRYIYRW